MQYSQFYSRKPTMNEFFVVLVLILLTVSFFFLDGMQVLQIGKHIKQSCTQTQGER